MAYKKGDEAKEAILNAATKLFIERGYFATTYTAIGEEAGINRSLTTYYYSEKKKLAEMVMLKILKEETSFVGNFLTKAYSPMLKYAISDRIHFRIMTQNNNVYRFYAEAVSQGLAANIFEANMPYRPLYEEMAKYYHISMEYPREYYSMLASGLEYRLVQTFPSVLAADETLLRFVISTLPLSMGVPKEEVLYSIEKSKDLCKDIETYNFDRFIIRKRLINRR